ncbi:unnamed protein product [Moneuplotes crassus]|uniref:PPM-type phosphatase domain-containing protein n=1 Tax=Euplotes crassus TaxID=5936 RepID=A0AAD2D1I9_EUPCR|nr:unnamed protein product [Moneuplotes crassus]
MILRLLSKARRHCNKLRSIIDNTFNMPAGVQNNSKEPQESRNWTQRLKNHTVEPYKIKFQNPQVLDNLVNARNFSKNKLNAESLERMKGKFALAEKRKNNISERQLPVIKPLNIPSSQIITKKLQSRNNKSNLSFGFENTFRRRKRELDKKNRDASGSKKSKNLSIPKGNTLEDLPSTSYLNSFTIDAKNNDEEESKCQSRDQEKMNTNHRPGIGPIQDLGKIKNIKLNTDSSHKFSLNSRIMSPYGHSKGTRNAKEFHKHFTIDQKNRTQDVLDAPDVESINSVSRGPSRARKIFKGVNTVELYKVKTQCGRAPSSSKKKKVNQDSYIVKPNISGQEDTWMFSILDGHGIDGHLVSDYAKNQLVDEFELYMKQDFKRKLSATGKQRRKSKNGLRGSQNLHFMHSLSKRSWKNHKPKMKSSIFNSFEVFNKVSPLDSETESLCLDSELGSSRRSAMNACRKTNTKIKEALRKAFNNTHEMIVQQPFDTKLSGTTCVTIVVKENKVFIANVGDSRVVICRQNSNFLWKPHQISRDHKPELRDEKERILSNRGRIHPFCDNEGNFVGPHRVWHPSFQYPGLAMSRSLGDEIAHQYGVTSDPEITEYEIQSEDKFIILASDGIWEFMTNQEVIDILSEGIEQDDYQKAIDDLISQAHEEWLINDICVDDITCILIKLNN